VIFCVSPERECVFPYLDGGHVELVGVCGDERVEVLRLGLSVLEAEDGGLVDVGAGGDVDASDAGFFAEFAGGLGEPVEHRRHVEMTLSKEAVWLS
jgi:hypothetical protein